MDTLNLIVCLHQAKIYNHFIIVFTHIYLQMLAYWLIGDERMQNICKENLSPIDSHVNIHIETKSQMISDIEKLFFAYDDPLFADFAPLLTNLSCAPGNCLLF